MERSGIGTAVRQQRNALARTEIEVVTTIRDHIRGHTTGRRNPQTLLEGIGADGLDLVHCNVIGPGTLGVVAWAKATGTPLVLHAHVTSEDFAGSFRGSRTLSGPLRRYLRWLYSQADVVACPSEYTKSILSAYPVDAPIRVITNGVDVDRFVGVEDLREQSRDRHGLSGTVIFAVGNVFERKGLGTFCRLARETPYEFVWFGPYERGVLASAVVRRWTKNPPENVTFTGWIDDIRGAYAAGDVFLFPTTAENQGIAVLEAMACGKPVVLRRLPVFEELYTHGEDCLLCETRAEFAAALDRLDGNPQLRERLGENARETARAHDLDRVAGELLTLYESCAGEEIGNGSGG